MNIFHDSLEGRPKTGEEGVAFLELALVLPLVLLLLIGGFEFSRLSRIRQATNSFTHGLSKTIERNCRTEIDAHQLTGATSSNIALIACLSQFSGSASISLGSETFQIDVLNVVYKWDPATNTPVDVARSNGPALCPMTIAPGLTVSCSTVTSRLNDSTVSAQHGAALAQAGDMIFVESTVQVNPLLGNVLRFFGLGFPTIYSLGVS